MSMVGSNHFMFACIICAFSIKQIQTGWLSYVEEDVLHMYYRCADDAYSIKVMKVFALHGAVPLQLIYGSRAGVLKPAQLATSFACHMVLLLPPAQRGRAPMEARRLALEMC